MLNSLFAIAHWWFPRLGTFWNLNTVRLSSLAVHQLFAHCHLRLCFTGKPVSSASFLSALPTFVLTIHLANLLCKHLTDLYFVTFPRDGLVIKTYSQYLSVSFYVTAHPRWTMFCVRRPVQSGAIQNADTFASIYSQFTACSSWRCSTRWSLQ